MHEDEVISFKKFVSLVCFRFIAVVRNVDGSPSVEIVPPSLDPYHVRAGSTVVLYIVQCQPLDPSDAVGLHVATAAAAERISMRRVS